jgi:hypothetical protein
MVFSSHATSEISADPFTAASLQRQNRRRSVDLPQKRLVWLRVNITNCAALGEL